MEELKNYKTYYINKETWKNRNKIETIRALLKATKKDIENMEEWEKRRKAEHLTQKQYNLLLNNNIKDLKPLLKKQLEKEKNKLIEEKEKALSKYNNIKKLKDIKSVNISIIWSNRRLSTGAYQTKGIAQVLYKNGEYQETETSFTTGCGYDKPSTTLSQICNELLKIIPLKHYKKILNDEEKHYKYYALEPLYFQYGVGVSSYENLFKNLGYKVKTNYYKNESITIYIYK